MSDERTSSVGSGHSQVFDYVSLARPQHWWKNSLVLAGYGLAQISQGTPSSSTNFAVVLALLSTCALASSNYVLNELLDSQSDQFHPEKQRRPLSTGRINRSLAYVQWIGLVSLGLALSTTINSQFTYLSIAFLIAGLCYNVAPVRLKDLPMIDVISEAINSPIRILLGWSIILPVKFLNPTILLIFWCAGMSLMALKRLNELQQFETQAQAARYRKSFSWYTRKRLLAIGFVSIIASFLCVLNLLSQPYWGILK